MVSGFICGTSNLPREEDDFERLTRSADSSPRKHCKSRISSKSNKNPYSSRGLDKFSALLAEVEEKRQQIYSELDPDQISLVRFVYSNDHNIKPIVVKAKRKSDLETKTQKTKNDDKPLPILKKLPSSKSMAVSKQGERKCPKKMKMFCDKLRVCQWNQPQYYLPLAVILILMFLVFFGRTFTIMCTSIGWYVIPTIANNEVHSLNVRRSFKKKDFATRRSSNKKLMTKEGTVSFKIFEAKSQQQSSNRNSI